MKWTVPFFSFLLQILLAHEEFTIDSDGEELKDPSGRFTDLNLIKESELSLIHPDFQEYCNDEKSYAAILLKSEFECLTSYRYFKDFSVFTYLSSSFNDYILELKDVKLVSEDDLLITIMPGPTTMLEMSNRIISPFTDVITHLKSKSRKKYAIIYKCNPSRSIPKSLVNRFGHAYFDGLPQRRNIVQKDAQQVFDNKKFISISPSTHVTLMETFLAPGIAYEVRIDGEYNVFRPFIGVELLWTEDGIRYPEMQDNVFTIVSPVYKTASKESFYGYANLLIYHHPGTEVSVTIARNWSLSIALMARRNLDLLTWILVLFLIPLDLPIERLMIALIFAAIFFRMVLSGSVIHSEVFYMSIIAFAVANTLIFLTRSLLELISKIPRKVGEWLTKMVPIIICLMSVMLKIWGLLPFLLAMQMLILKTMLSGSTQIHASSLFLQALATAMYIVPWIPDILAATQHKIPIQLNLGIDTILIWALIFWSKLLRGNSSTNETTRFIRYCIHVLLVVYFLPDLTLASIWPAFCVYLTINLIFNLIRT